MKRFLISLATLFLTLGLLSNEASALGLGIDLTGGGGKTNWTVTEDWFGTESDVDSENSHGGIGFVLDTAVAKDTLFNYRLNIGVEAVDYEMEHNGGTYETKGWYFANDFGFGIIRNEKLRLWLGPELRFSYTEGKHKDYSDLEAHILSAGLGPVAGLNLNFGDTMTLAFKAGILATSSTGNVENSGFGPDLDIDGHGSFAFGNVALIFRLGDEYSK